MLNILVRILLIYIILSGGMRLAGKRQIGELQLSELVTAFLLSELAALCVTDADIPLLYSVIPVVVLLCLEILIPYFTSRHPKLKRIISGAPSVIIRRGVLDQVELSKMRMGADELLAELRLAGIGDISQVEYAILEENGHLSVIPKEGERPATPNDLSLFVEGKGIAHPLIIEGVINEYNLALVGHDRDWLFAELKRRKCPLGRVLLFTLDDAGGVNIIKYEE